LLEALSPDPGIRGLEFERVCKWFLENDPVYAAQLERVWLWKDWPDRWGRDAGIDLVARARDGQLWAIQAKAYDRATTITKADVDTFLAESSRPQVGYRLLIATTDRLAANARRTLVAQEKPVGLLLFTGLLDAPVDWPASPDDLHPRGTQPKTPRPHQSAAVRDVAACLETSDRARLVMACGTGKTLTALFLAEEMASKRTLVLVPSLSLLGQTLAEWLANSRSTMEFKAVCSDATVTADRDAPVSTTSDLALPVTTDPDDIAAFLRRDGHVHRVVFATYQSSQRIAEAMALDGVPSFDLAVADEAHRCTGPVSGDFATILNAEAIRAERRVFMTATPRYFTGRIIKEAKEADLEVASMDDEATFGPLAHRLTFGQAIGKGLLTDYQVAIIGVDDTMYRDWVDRGRMVAPDGGTTTDARTLSSHIGLAKAMGDFDLRRTITFHSRVERARRFSDMLPTVISWMPAGLRPAGSLDARYVSGYMNAGDRKALLQRLEFPTTDRAMLANARCLTEGIDVPALDGIAFIDPRRSEIDVVQAVGRAIRNAPDKKVGTIILPVFISDTDDPDTALSDSAFRTVWAVLNAMRAHDEELAEWLDALRRQLGRNPGGALDLPGKVILDLPERVSPAFAKAVRVRIIECSSSSWEHWFGVLEVFVEREGHARVPATYSTAGLKLGTWVSNQRRARVRLSQGRREQLEALPGWTWEPINDQWEAGFAALTRYVEREGHARVPGSHVEADLNLGQWVSDQRKNRARLPLERRSRLQALPGWVWNVNDSNWEEHFAALRAFVAREGHARVPHRHREGGLLLGQWITNHRVMRDRLSQERKERLEALPGWTWNEMDTRWEDAYAALLTFVQREGHARVPNLHAEGEVALGAWVLRQRRNRGEALSRHRRERLEALPGWTWHEFDARWEEAYAVLVTFVKREGHARVPQHHVEGKFALGHWVTNQRRYRDNMAEGRRERLEALPGWTWNVFDAQWEAGFGLLDAYVKREGHARVPGMHNENGFALGQWVSDQRRDCDRLPLDRRERLEALPGWVWRLGKGYR
jgi:superfamily II DNA or RNA helicase